MRRLTIEGAEQWLELGCDSASASCSSYSIDDAWIPWLARCSVGIIGAETNFGSGKRYRLKLAACRPLNASKLTNHLAPRSLGIAQVNQDRVDYLSEDAALSEIPSILTREGAMQIATLGLAKAVSIYYPTSQGPPTMDALRIVVITHNAGWMNPRNARVQDVLKSLALLVAGTRTSGFLGTDTMTALDLAARHMGCQTLEESLLSSDTCVSPRVFLNHPDFREAVLRTPLMRGLGKLADDAGKDLSRPKFPLYRFRKWHTGWVTSVGYARKVLSYAGIIDRSRRTDEGDHIS